MHDVMRVHSEKLQKFKYIVHCENNLFIFRTIFKSCYNKPISWSRRHTWRFYTPIATNLIAGENRCRFSPQMAADTLGDFFRRWRQCGTSALIPGSIGWRLKITRTNVNKQNRDSEAKKSVGCCHNFATIALQEAVWKVGQ